MKILTDRRGAIAAASAVVMVVVLGFAGLAIDATRLWMVNARLKTAIDAAALVAARQISLAAADRDAQAQAVYWANFTQNGRTPNYLGSTLQDATITPIAAADPTLPPSRIQVTGQASVPTTLFSIINRSNTDVIDTAIAERQGTGLELALVLDVTGSMGVTNIRALRQAATDLVDILYAGQERQPNLWVAVVPYTATVNIGTQRADWLVTGSLNQNDFLPSIWRGCVQARAGTITTAGATTTYPSGADASEDPPSTWRFHPHFWPSNRNRYSQNASGALLTVRRNNINFPINRGDNAWIPGAGGTVVTNANTAPNFNTAVWEIDPSNPGTDEQDERRGNETRGPNIGCGRAILPLTRDRTPVIAQINALRHSHRGGTMANLGLQFGLGTLSPQWRDDWDLNEFREGQRLPLDYGTRNMTKAVVLMTDGQNEWYDFPDGLPGAGCRSNGTDPPCSETNLTVLNTLNEGSFTASGNNPRVIGNNDADQTAYGRLRDNRLGLVTLSNANARAAINARMTQLCNTVKGRGITVYTVVFIANPSQEVTNLYRGCASAPENFFPAPTRESLGTAFRTIAGQLANLRLAQ